MRGVACSTGDSRSHPNERDSRPGVPLAVPWSHVIDVMVMGPEAE